MGEFLNSLINFCIFKTFSGAKTLYTKKGETDLNNKKIFENFISENLDSVFRFAYTYTKNKEDAEDIVCESIEKALKAAKNLKHPEYIKTWFYKIISNTALSFLSKKAKCEVLSFDDMPDQPFSDDYSNLDFENLVKTLDLKYKSVIVLRFFEDMKISDISKILGINESTVKTRLYTALKLLKEDMEGIEL